MVENAGVQLRAKRDLAEVRDPLEFSKEMLAKKAKMYNDLKRDSGTSLDYTGRDFCTKLLLGAFQSADKEGFLVDFERKGQDSEVRGAPLHEPDEEEDLVEFIDEFGRTRTCKSSELEDRMKLVIYIPGRHI